MIEILLGVLRDLDKKERDLEDLADPAGLVVAEEAPEGVGES